MSRNEKPRPFETNADITEARKAVIDGILSSGLKAGRYLEKTRTFFVQSADPIPYSSVFGCQIRSRSDIHGALYHDSESILPVLAERAYDLAQIERLQRMPEDKIIRYISERMRSSVMVICNLDDLKNVIGNITMNGVVPADDIQSVVIPEDIWTEYTKMKYRNDAKFPKVAQVAYAEKYLNAFGRVIKVPDYESVLQTRFEQNRKPLWVSGVRLPVHDEDLKRQ